MSSLAVFVNDFSPAFHKLGKQHIFHTWSTQYLTVLIKNERFFLIEIYDDGKMF